MKKKQKQIKKNSTVKSNSSVSGITKYLVVILFFLIIAAIIYMNINPPAPEPEPKQYRFKKEGLLTIVDSLGVEIAKVDIEIADTDYERTLGLMYRQTMAENEGMLFIFPDEEIRSFWMKNTILPLDMLFINSERRIVTIHKNTTPYSEQSYRSTQPAKYVLELNAGYCDLKGIKTGDMIRWL